MHAKRVYRNRFLREGMFACFEYLAQMHGTKVRWRTKQHHISIADREQSARGCPTSADQEFSQLADVYWLQRHHCTQRGNLVHPLRRPRRLELSVSADVAANLTLDNEESQ